MRTSLAALTSLTTAKPKKMIIRAIQDNDWQAILAIQDECYPTIEPESLAVLKSKAELSPQSCFVIVDNNTVLGYCLAHPWLLGRPPALAQQLTPPTNADTLYLHDIALSSASRGKGAGEQVFSQLLTQAKRMQFTSLSLVAVQGASSYWQRLGFKSRIIDKSLDSYTHDACYMVYQITE